MSKTAIDAGEGGAHEIRDHEGLHRPRHSGSRRRRRSSRSGSPGGSTGRRYGLLALSALIALLMLALLAISARLLYADVLAHQAQAFLDDWRTRGRVPSDRAWQIALDAAARSVAWYPVPSGAHVERLGKIYEWRYLGRFPGHPDAVATRQQALAAYRTATTLRPLSPFPWSRIAQLKVEVLEFDDELAHALSQSVVLGPWRPWVHRTVVRTGVLAWRELSLESRAVVLDAAVRAWQQSPRDGALLLDYALRFHLGEPFCAALAGYLPADEKHCTVAES